MNCVDLKALNEDIVDWLNEDLRPSEETLTDILARFLNKQRGVSVQKFNRYEEGGNFKKGINGFGVDFIFIVYDNRHAATFLIQSKLLKKDSKKQLQVNQPRKRKTNTRF